MAEAGGEVLATRVAFLELKDERRLIQEGYELLDEKRVLLATEMLRQLRHYLALQDDLSQHEQQARTALRAQQPVCAPWNNGPLARVASVPGGS